MDIWLNEAYSKAGQMDEIYSWRYDVCSWAAVNNKAAAADVWLMQSIRQATNMVSMVG